jgi:hypothetical protein
VNGYWTASIRRAALDHACRIDTRADDAIAIKTSFAPAGAAPPAGRR